MHQTFGMHIDERIDQQPYRPQYTCHLLAGQDAEVRTVDKLLTEEDGIRFNMELERPNDMRMHQSYAGLPFSVQPCAALGITRGNFQCDRRAREAVFRKPDFGGRIAAQTAHERVSIG